MGKPSPPFVGHAVIVDIDHPPAPGEQARSSVVLADHLGRRAASVDVLDSPRPTAHRPELVVGLTPHLESAELAARIAHSAGARLIVVVQELLGALSAPREERLLSSADYVAIGSETFRQPARRYGVPDNRIAVLPDWAHLVPTWLDRLDARRALGWPERGFLAVHLGTDERHDVRTVLEAARCAGPDVLVVLVGQDLRGDAAALCAGLPNVLVAAHLAADQWPLTMVAADVLVISEALTPQHLVLPAELASCLAAARPVVAAASPGGVTQAELGRVPGAGIVVPAGASRPLAEALLDLRSNPGRRVAMGLAALAHAEGQLSLTRALARFDAIVDATLLIPTVPSPAPPPAALLTVG